MDKALKKDVMIHFLIHFLLASLTGLFGFFLTKNFFYFFIGFIFNIGLDFDHLIEYFLVSFSKFNLNQFLSGNYFKHKKNLYLFFHAWEYLLVSLIFWLFFKNIFFLVIFIGMATHLAFDQWSYKNSWKVYSLFFRAKNKFNKSVILPDNE